MYNGDVLQPLSQFKLCFSSECVLKHHFLVQGLPLLFLCAHQNRILWQPGSFCLNMHVIVEKSGRIGFENVSNKLGHLLAITKACNIIYAVQGFNESSVACDVK